MDTVCKDIYGRSKYERGGERVIRFLYLNDVIKMCRGTRPA